MSFISFILEIKMGVLYLLFIFGQEIGDKNGCPLSSFYLRFLEIKMGVLYLPRGVNYLYGSSHVIIRLFYGRQASNK